MRRMKVGLDCFIVATFLDHVCELGSFLRLFIVYCLNVV